MKTLLSKQKRFLKKNFNLSAPVIHVGKDGLASSTENHISKSLDDHEVLKIRINKTCDMDKNEAAEWLRENLSCNILRVIGNTILIYRESTVKPSEERIELPV